MIHLPFGVRTLDNDLLAAGKELNGMLGSSRILEGETTF
jgi:hypothetical protein